MKYPLINKNVPFVANGIVLKGMAMEIWFKIANDYCEVDKKYNVE